MSSIHPYFKIPSDSFLAALEEREVSKVELSTERANQMFLPVRDKNGISYGGNQSWWKTIEGRERRWEKGCGVVAACNFIYYHAFTKDRKEILPPAFQSTYQELHTALFLSFMDFLWDKVAMVPFFGGTTQSLLKWSLKRYFAGKGVAVKAFTSRIGSSTEKVRKIIKDGLGKDIPVIILTNFFAPDQWENYGSHHNMHVMTITKWFQTGDGKEYLTVSTWGERQVVALEHYLKYGRIFGFTCFYLEEKSNHRNHKIKIAGIIKE